MFWQILESRYKPLIPIFTKQLESSENIKISYLGFFDGFMPFYRKSVDMCEKGETHFPGTEPKI